MSTLILSTADYRALFAEEIERHAGRVSDTFDDGTCLFQRSILPGSAEVQPQDCVYGGVALKASPSETCVIPYVFRQVCQNGVIMARSQQARTIAFERDASPEEIRETVREAISACCRPEIFGNAVDVIASGVTTSVDLVMSLMAYSQPHSEWIIPHEIIDSIIKQYLEAGDQSRFGLMNAVTAVARDTQNPEDRWRLEEMGGGIAAGIEPPAPADAPGVQREFVKEEAAVC